MAIVSLVLGVGILGLPSGSATADGEPGAIRARYEGDLVGQAQATCALPAGPRTIRRFVWVPDPEAPGAWRSARLRLIWDGDDPDRAGVDVPLGRFVSPVPERADADRDGSASPRRFVNRRSMPYRRSGRLVIEAEDPVRGAFRLDVEAGLGSRGYLRAAIHERERSDAERPSGPEDGRSEGAGGVSSPVRFWYDEQPGP